MSIKLEINADTPEELIATINGLATLGQRQPFGVTVEHTPEPRFVAAEPEALNETPAQTAERRPRRTKAEMEVARAAQSLQPSAAPVGEKASTSEPTSKSTESVSLAAASAAAPASLADQIRQVNAEADEVVTFETVSEEASQAINRGLANAKIREHLEAKFLDAAGAPVRRLRDIQPKDFDAVVAWLRGQ